jgi:hypothetical protein
MIRSSSSLIRRVTRAASIAILFALPCLFAPHAFAEDASSHFEQGVAFFKDGDFEGALVSFKRAYELSPEYRVLYNLGQTSRELRDYASALENFERYLAEGGNEIEEARRKRVEGWITELKPKVARLTIKTNVAGAEVTVDDLSRGKTPLEGALIVNAGRRKISLVKSGYATVQRIVEVAGTQPVSLDLELVPLDSQAPVPTGIANPSASAAPTTSTSVPSEPTPAPWIALAGTAAFGITTGVLGGVSLSKKSALDDELARFPSNGESIEAARGTAKDFALATDIMAGITIASAAVTVVLFITEYATGDTAEASSTRPSSKRKAHEIARDAASLRVRF